MQFRKKLMSAVLLSSTALLTACNCGDSQYQSFDGSCNNTFFTDWGKAGNYFEPGPEGSEYKLDGITPKQTINERYISRELMGNKTGVSEMSDSGLSHSVLWMGQFVTHDFSRHNVDFSHPYYTDTIPNIVALANQWGVLPDGDERDALIQQAEGLIVANGGPGVLIEDTQGDELAHISRSFNPLLPYTGVIPYPLLLLPDAIYDKPAFGNKKIKNFINAWIDLSQVYGDTEEINASLRTGVDGKMVTIDLDVTTEYRPLEPFTRTLHDVLPTSDMVAHEPSVDPTRPFNPRDEFSSGDPRASENYGLTSFHLAFHRYHNIVADQAAVIIADQLQGLSSDERDEAIFQFARRFVIAVYQHILFDEYLPALLGSQFDQLVGDYEGYDPTVKPETNPTMTNAAFRYAHSAVPQDFLVFDENGENTVFDALRDEIYVTQFGQTTVPGLGQTGPRAPFTIVNHVAVHGGFDNIIRSMAVTATNKIDLVYEDSVRNVVAAQSLINAGIDLAAIDVYRAREFGVPNYNKLRKIYGDGSVYSKPGCYYAFFGGKDPLSCFTQITSNLEVANALRDIYGHVNKVDGIIGLLAEDHYPGSPLPKTMAVLIAKEFVKKRAADRFWYENVLPEQQQAIVEGITMTDVFAQTACGIGQPDCHVSKAELDPTGNTVFMVPEDREQESFELGACQYTTMTDFGPNFQCDEPFNRQACDSKGGVFIGPASTYSNSCPTEQRIGTCVFSFIHMRSRFYQGGAPAVVQKWVCESFMMGFWMEGADEFLPLIEANGGRIDNVLTPGAPFPGTGGGTGGETQEGFCSYTQSTPGGEFAVCSSQTSEQSCTDLAGFHNAFGCATDNLVGYCTLADGSDLNYYEGDAASLATGCGFQGGTWTTVGGGDTGGGTGQEPEGSCLYMQSSPGGSFNVCHETVLASTCSVDLAGTFAVTACDTSAIIGTCSLADGSDVHYYDGDAASLETGCGFQGGTWTAPATEPEPEPEPVGSNCFYTQSSVGGSFAVCHTDQSVESCNAQSGTLSAVDCSVAGAIGYCSTAGGDIYYLEGSASSLATGCGFQGGTWVTL